MAIPRHTITKVSNYTEKDNTKLAVAICAIVLVIFFVTFFLILRSMDDKHSSVSENNETNTATSTTEKTITKTTSVSYTSTTIQDSSLDEGKSKVITEGVNGTKTITYRVTFKDGKKISEEITKQPINEVRAIGTKHVYTGYCSVEGRYRHRYAQCYGDYSP